MLHSLSRRSTAEHRESLHALPLSSPAGAVAPTPRRPGAQPNHFGQTMPCTTAIPVTQGALSPSTFDGRPRALGYMQVSCAQPDSESMRVEQTLLHYADARGLNFVTFVFDFEPGTSTGFTTLLEEVRATKAHYVVVPSLNHFAHHARLQRLRLERLWLEAAAIALVPPSFSRTDV